VSQTTLPVVDGGPPAGLSARGRQEDTIRAGVLAALGRPADLYRVAVLPLWGNHYRVNVVTGADPTAVRIPHSFFLTADASGTITEARPPITRWY
jgi:hypothetical protein